MAVRRGSADGSFRLVPRDTRQASIIQLLNIELPDWHKDAVCASTDPEDFFPDKGGSTAFAKATCNGGRALSKAGPSPMEGCPVREQCLEWALAHEVRYGVWGGLSERERRRLARKRRLPWAM